MITNRTTTTQTIELTRHAIERYAERVRPGLTYDRAEFELSNAALVGDITERPPAWHAGRSAQEAPFYLNLADVVLPLVPCRADPDVLVATTCIPRGTLTPEARRYRTRRKQARARARHGARTTLV